MQGFDKFEEHGLDSTELDKIVEPLDAYPKLKSVYLFLKVVTYFPELPCYVMVVDSVKDRKIQDTELQTILVNTLAQELILPGYTLIRSRIGSAGNIKKAIKEITGAQIFFRGG